MKKRKQHDIEIPIYIVAGTLAAMVFVLTAVVAIEANKGYMCRNDLMYRMQNLTVCDSRMNYDL